MRVVYIINNGDGSILCFLFSCGWVDDRVDWLKKNDEINQINHQIQYVTNLRVVALNALGVHRVLVPQALN